MMHQLKLPQASCFKAESSRVIRRSPIQHVQCSGKGFGDKPPPKQQGQKKRRDDRNAGSDPVQPFSVKGEQEEPQTSGRPFSDDIREVPEAINQRLLNRMLIFSLGPVLLGFITLPLLAYIQVALKVDLPQGTAFVVSGLCFGAGLLGITYGILSASWDENVEGSSLGLEEFKSNAGPLFDRIKPK